MIGLNYIINLDRKPERWQSINKLINSCCLKDEKYIKFSAFDGKDYQSEIKKHNLESHSIIKKLKDNKATSPAGAFGCLISHVLVLQKIVDNSDISNNDYVGIFEDDFLISGSINKFNENYTNFKKLNLNEFDIDLLYIGGRFEPNFLCLDDKLFTDTDNLNLFIRNKIDKTNENYDRTTSSYIVKKGSCKKIINCISNNLLLLVKDGQTSKPIDWILPNLSPNVKTFDYFPHFFYSPKDGPSDIQGKQLEDKIQF